MSAPAIRSNPPTSTVRASDILGGHEPAQASAPPPSAQAVQERAIDTLSSISASRPRPRAPSWQRMADQVARAYEGGGDHAVHQFLRSNPSALRALTTAPEAAVEQRMQAATDRSDGSNALGAVRDHLEGAVRSNILQSAARRLGGAVHQLERLGALMRTSPEVFLRAPADSEKGQQLRALGLDSSASPAEVNKAVNEAVAGLQELQERFAGRAWEIGDFPASAARAARELGLRSHTGETTVADRVLNEDSGLGQFDVATGLDVAHGVIGVVETVGHGLVGGLPAIAFLAVGYHIHHAADHARGADIVLGRALGL